MRRAVLLAVALSIAGSIAALVCLVSVGADGPAGNDYWEQYRAPWPERSLSDTPSAMTRYERYDGCPVGSNGTPPCQYHSTAVPNYRWAIDLNNETDETQGGNSDCDDVLKATRLGAVEFYEPGWPGNSSYLGIQHYNGPGDSDETWYIHVAYPNDAVICDPQCHPWDSVYAQGDFAARMGDLVTDACHLHFYLTDGPDSWNPSLDPWVSGSWPWTGYDLQHLSDDNMTGHASNNTGAGYGRPYTGTCPPEVPGGLCLDDGPENAPLTWSIRNYARDMAYYAQDAGSTRASIQGPCGANRRWVKGCYFNWGVYKYSQNFVLNYLGLQIPLSITEGYPGGTARRVMKAMWKAYGQKCGSDYTYLWIGRPTNEEFDLGSPFTQQNFERGFMQAWRNDPFNVMVSVFDNSGGLLCTQGAGSGGFYDWLDMNHQPCYDVNSDSWVDSGDQGALGRRCCTSESNPINSLRPGYDYDDRYDVNRDGFVDSGDAGLVNRQVAHCSSWGCICK